MRILLLTQVVPYPPDSGPKIKTYHVLRYLAQGHEVHLISFVRSEAEAASLETLRSSCASATGVPLKRSRVKDVAYLLRSLVAGRPFLVERDDLAAMRQVVRDRLDGGSFDAVHADQLTMGQFAVDLPVPLRVLDEHNAVWTIVRRSAQRELGPRRVVAELEWRKLRAYEGALCRRFDHVTVVSTDDQAALEQAAGAPIPATVVPIAIDTDELRFVARGEDARHVLSVATMFYPPNVEGVYWFATEIFQLIRRAVPDAQFYIVGSRPPERITRLGVEGSGIVVTGYVPNLETLISQSRVLVVPVHSGSGMRVKILEAFARGIPIVSTTVGVEGIDARPGEHLLVADDPEGFAQAVVQLLQDRALANRVAQAGRALVEARYDWRAALRGLDNVYARPVAQRPHGSPIAGR
jgi:glycosyltransferase involved in cell wall biosynthesis